MPTIDDFIEHLRLDRRRLLTPAFEIWNDNCDAYDATVTVTLDYIELTTSGGPTPSPTPTPAGGVFYFVDYPTIGVLVDAINSYAISWSALRLGHSDALSSSLYPQCTDIEPCCDSRLVVDYIDTRWIQNLLDYSLDFIQRYCYRTFATTVYTETHDGNSTEQLQLNNYPVTALTSVSIDSVVVAVANYTFTPGDGILWDISGAGWPDGRQNIAIDYTAGYAVLPDELEALQMEIGTYFYFKAGRDPAVRSTKLSSYSFSLFESGLPEGLIERLALWRRIEPPEG